MMMRTLLGSKYRILTAHNGEEALNVVRHGVPDLVVSDVMMPGMDGNELTRQLKSTPEWSHLPVILLTAKISEEERHQSMLIGADDYVTKPFRLSDLELRINNLIENRKRILRDQNAIHQEPEEHQQTPDELFMERARQCVFKHLDDSEFDRDAFASEMGASTSTLYNRLRAITGMNVSSYIRDIRLKEARRLAQMHPTMRVSDLAYRVGFKDPKYFATSFKKEFGIQPREFMDSIQK
jgi:DNA-binding response OmpR family regulator